MPPRSSRSSTPKTSFNPPSDVATFKDLLLFEERLKTTAATLKRRKLRYQLWPLNFMLSYWPLSFGPQPPITPHPYFAHVITLIAATTLFLFMTNGMYSEKIGYANSPPSPGGDSTTLANGSRSSSAARSAITPIPPPINPRGELIFNSRVDKSFREGYEKYRAQFEKAREEKARKEYEAKVAKSWWRWFLLRGGRSGKTANNSASSSREGSATAASPNDSATPRRGRATRTPTGSRSNTPHGSRKPSPAGSIHSTTSRRRSGNINSEIVLESVPERGTLEGDLRRTPTPSLTSNPPSSPPGDESDASTTANGEPSLRQRKERRRTESFSFLLGKPDVHADS
ncbi:hypothetical protein FRB99_004102 [Tulasnella sp. 403]|nr:hypothetical protein FRB99_004102 [Tulasnella sp. 403]